MVPAAIVVLEGRFVVAGLDTESPLRSGSKNTQVPAVWVSTDGSAWSRHDGVPNLSAMAASQGSIVGVGTWWAPWGDDSTGLWQSSDGVSWNRIATPEELGGTPQLVVHGRTGWLAVGIDEVGSRRAWRSADLGTWEPVTSAALQGLNVRAVAGGPEGYVAIGDASDGLRSAFSPDGIFWRRGASLGDARSPTVAVRSEGWVMAATAYAPSVRSDGIRVWTSTDGLRWRQTAFLRPAREYLPLGPAVTLEMNAIARFGPGYVALGQYAWGASEWAGLSWVSATGTQWQSTRSETGSRPLMATKGDVLVAIGHQDDHPGGWPRGWAVRGTLQTP